MKAILKFDLPEDRENYNHCNKAIDYYSALWDLDQWLRSEIKHQDKDELQVVRDKLYEVMEDNDVKFE